MAQSERELEKELSEAGKRLLSPPSSVSELLASLDRVECFLARVEQSPSESMKKALSPSSKALIRDDLLRHSHVDVKVSVASCISEITRITAPDAPYEDNQMKEVFQLIVSSFDKLDDRSSPSYSKRTSILETVAKVRSCVVMLDLECDALIVEMFRHFLRSIRDDHPVNVFSSMETIMTLVLEESEEISLDLLTSILDVLKTDNKEVLPIARQLGEKVIEKCANKVKPYLLPAVKSRGASISDYSKIIANVCQAGLEAVEPSDGEAASKNLADERDSANKPLEEAVEVAMETQVDVAPPEEVGPTTVGSPSSVMGNGTLQKEIEPTSVGNDNSKEEDEGHDTHDEVKTDGEQTKTMIDSQNADEQAKSKSKPEKSNKRKSKKANSLKSSSETSEPTLVDGKKEAVKVSGHQEKDDKDVDNEPVDVPSSSPSKSLADESRSRKVGRGKKDHVVEESVPAGDIDSKKESNTKKESEGTSEKASSAPIKEDGAPSPLDASKNEDENISELDAKQSKQSSEKVEEVCSEHEDEKKGRQGKGTPAKGLGKIPSKDGEKTPVPLTKSATKSSKDESGSEKASKTSSKRKRISSRKKAPKTKVYGPELVGSRIQVWWPADKKFYEGVIESFDPDQMKHKVVYIDGDVEVLKLGKEKWRALIEDESSPDQGHTSEGESPDESSETPKGKQAKTSANLRTKQGKIVTSTEKEGASSSKSKATPKSGRKQKDDSKPDVKSKEEALKSVNKTDEKIGGKSKDSKASNKSSNNTPKSVGKSKDEDIDTSKVLNKLKNNSKGKSSKSGTKSNTNNGTGKIKACSSSSKDEDAPDMEESPEPVKTPEIAKGKSPSTSKKSSKSGNKRKRGAKG